MTKYKRRLGDRYDGRRVRGGDPLFHVMPKIMIGRNDSSVYFDEIIDMEIIDRYVHKRRAEDLPDLRVIHVLIAAMVRVVSQRPRINRFVCGKKIFARNYLRIALVIKKLMSIDGEEGIIQPYFEPSDTLTDVVRKVNEEIKKEIELEKGNSTDAFTRVFRFVPGFIISFIAFLARNLDKIGLMPKFINRASPFHSSLFITDIGSLGLRSAYHHLYEFGTCSVFIAIGKKERIPVVENGAVIPKKCIEVRFVIDERITDGFYNASIVKMFKRILKNPEILESPPETIVEDKVK